MSRWPPAPAVALVGVFVVATTVGPTAVDVPSDLPVYRGYAAALLDGFLPYRDFAVEYPPLALVPMVLAGTAGTGEELYAWTFGALMLLAALAAQQAAAALAGPHHGRTVAWAMVALPLAAGAIVRTRFDLVPAAMLAGGLALIVGRRPRLGFALLAAGTATKLFPAVAAAAALSWLVSRERAGGAVAGAAGAPPGVGWRGAWSRLFERGAALNCLVVFAGVLAVVVLPFVVVSPVGFVDQFVFHVKRPVQIESTPATVLWLVGDPDVTGAPVRPDEFKSNGLDHPAAAFVGGFFAILQLAAVVTAVALAARRPGSSGQLVVAAFAAVVAFVALGKVLSPQYLLWLAPLALAAAAHGARLPAALVLAAVPVTQLEFPHRYFDLVVDQDATTIAIVGVRNALLVGALGLAFRWLAAESRQPRRAE